MFVIDIPRLNPIHILSIKTKDFDTGADTCTMFLT